MSPPPPAHGRRSRLSIDTVTVDDQTVLVALGGDLDLWSAPQFRGTLHDLLGAGRNRLVLDLNRVQFMDSTAVGVLVGVERRLTDDQRLAIAQAGTAVLRVLELSGVAAGFRIFPTREAALSYVTLDGARTRQSSKPPLTADAALLLGIVSTAMPFAQSVEEQAERWLRALRRHGEAGAVLASLGVQEGPVSRLDMEEDGDEPSRPPDADAVALVTESAGELASERAAMKIATTDVLAAVMQVYGVTFARVLATHGVDIAELAQRLESVESARSKSHP
jgi:anti-sigma B factor antagonist